MASKLVFRVGVSTEDIDREIVANLEAAVAAAERVRLGLLERQGNALRCEVEPSRADVGWVSEAPPITAQLP